MNRLLNIPDVPIILAASTGENTNADKLVGIIVFLIKLVSPKTNPRNPPFLGPQNSDPKITGICIIVALITTNGIYPSGVKAIIMIMAVKRLVNTSCSVLLLRIAFLFPVIARFGSIPN